MRTPGNKALTMFDLLEEGCKVLFIDERNETIRYYI